jgi:hypothetical protein
MSFSLLLLLLFWRLHLLPLVLGHLACSHSELIWNYESDIATVGRTPRTGDQPSRKAATYTGQHKHRTNTKIHQCLERDSIPVFERAKTFRALYREPTDIGHF